MTLLAIEEKSTKQLADNKFSNSKFSNLDRLEAQAAHILLETIQLNPTAVMFSAGKDSLCVAHLINKLFIDQNGNPLNPFPLYHYDSGDNFSEVLEFRDDFVKTTNAKLIVWNVIEASQLGLISTPLDFKGNVLALSELIRFSQKDQNLKGLIGGGRRDEDPVRAKERIFSLRAESGIWDPYHQNPEVWNCFNTELAEGHHIRIFPISNWTERNVWEYIEQENIALPKIYYAHEREVIERDGSLYAYFPDSKLETNDRISVKKVRCRTVGDRKSTGFIESEATNAKEVLAEVLASRFSERAGRSEDQSQGTAMQDRKTKGWF